jgi:hypothetical protein
MWVRRSVVIETNGGFWIVLGLMALLFPLRITCGILLAAGRYAASGCIRAVHRSSPHPFRLGGSFCAFSPDPPQVR